ncbi:putative amidoligase domain-containing protein [Paenibacillus eucommiae]|uniref:Phage phiEco32-like COOH-NH2 ligase-type 2 n=1 Tax=Paenibacillus eucommiae TaxID=1355755 RepID=A0ABS4J5Y3_9BACL|nr:hypothetical protein [Paenibacillus eucommiae]MBP1995188.1 hypothetical protein [Paenibacillus eucommiae]
MQTFLLHSQEEDAIKLTEGLAVPSGSQLPTDWKGTAVVNWGAYLQEQTRQDLLTLQPVKAIIRAQQVKKREEILELHGIKTAGSHVLQKQNPYFPFKYKVAVFHLQALAIYEKKESMWVSATGPGTKNSQGAVSTGTGIGRDSSYKEVTYSQATFHMRRAAREAIKAIYALGLDYGIVTIGILSSGHTLVLNADPVPKLNRRLTELFARAIERYDAELTSELARSERAMLGSDPEFLLLSKQGKVVSASRFLEREGPVGCDAIVLSGHRVILPLAELRPQPSVDPRQLARNLHRTMQLAARAIPDESLAWLSGGMPLRGFALGGHIHFSRIWLNAHLLRALDNYLALPLMQIEGATTAQRRPRYGFLGDFRRQSHGGFEYRTLPSWLVSPAVARGVFALAAIIAEHYLSLPRRPLMEPDVQSFYYSGKKESVQEVIQQLWNDLEQLENYAEYADCLDPLKAMIIKRAPWNELADFRKTWKIAAYRSERSYPL